MDSVAGREVERGGGVGSVIYSRIISGGLRRLLRIRILRSTGKESR